MLAVDAAGHEVDGDQILAVARPPSRRRSGRRHPDDQPRLPPPDGRAGDPRGDHRRRRPLRARGAARRGRRPRGRAVGPRHLPRRARRRGRAAAGLLLCRAVVENGRPLADLAAVMPRYPAGEGERPVPEEGDSRRACSRGRAALHQELGRNGPGARPSVRAPSPSSGCSPRPKPRRKRAASVLPS